MAVQNSLFSQLANLKHVVKSGNIASNVLTRISSQHKTFLYSTVSSAAPATETKQPAKKMSKAMLAYLERAEAHDAFIKKEQENFKIGKRHLANMMGEDPEHFTQDDIDRSIEYLFPSGLFDKAARPLMKPPEVIFPPRKAAVFNEKGRPFHPLFYTTKPNYYKILYDAVEHMQTLNALEDSMIRKGISPDPNIQFDSTASEWVTKDGLEKILLESITDNAYEYFISTLQRLADHPYSYQVKNFLMTYRKERRSLTQSLIIPELNYDSDGRPFITVPNCMRKTSRGTVTLRGKGSGKIIVNGQPLHLYFPNSQEREQKSEYCSSLVSNIIPSELSIPSEDALKALNKHEDLKRFPPENDEMEMN